MTILSSASVVLCAILICCIVVGAAYNFSEGFDDGVDKKLEAIARDAVDQLNSSPIKGAIPQGSIERVAISKLKYIDKNGGTITEKDIKKEGFFAILTGAGSFVARVSAQPKFVIPTLRNDVKSGKGVTVLDDLVLTRKFIVEGKGNTKNRAIEDAEKQLEAIRLRITLLAKKYMKD